MRTSKNRTFSPTQLLFGCALSIMTLAGCSTAELPTAVANSTEVDLPDPSVLGTVQTPTSVEEVRPRVIHVGIGGDDSGTGSDLEAPLATANRAIELAQPGDTIRFGAGTFQWAKLDSIHGLPDAPITLEGVGNHSSILTGEGYHLDGNPAALFIYSSSYIVVRNLGLTNSFAGSRIEQSDHIQLSDISIFDIGQPGLVIAKNSGHVSLQQSTIMRTGLLPGAAQFGEGIYIGSGDGAPDDRTHDVLIQDNEITLTSGEAIDIKPFTSNITIRSNWIHDIEHFNSGAVVTGVGILDQPNPNVLIENNRIARVQSWNQRTSFDGNGIVISAPAVVRNNIVWDVQDVGILVDKNFPSDKSASIYHNTVFAAGRRPIEVQSGPNSGNPDIRNNLGSDLPANLPATVSDFTSIGDIGFQLAPGSAAIDAGDPSVGVTTDLGGQQRDSSPDYGALEHPVGSTADGQTASTPAANSATAPTPTLPSISSTAPKSNVKDAGVEASVSTPSSASQVLSSGIDSANRRSDSSITVPGPNRTSGTPTPTQSPLEGPNLADPEPDLDAPESLAYVGTADATNDSGSHFVTVVLLIGIVVGAATMGRLLLGQRPHQP